MSIWSPLLFNAEGKKQGYDCRYLHKLTDQGNKLSDSGLPVIFTLAHLCAMAGVSFSLIHSCVSRKYDPYRSFTIKKRSGGYRQIVVPEPELMHLQRWINEFILKRAKVHSCAAAYISGSDIKMNASKHLGANWLIKLDIQRFFESISELQVYYIFHRLGYPKLLSFEMARICTRVDTQSNRHFRPRWNNRIHHFEILEYCDSRVGYLPQGAPTSPSLSNLTCRKLDKEIYDLSCRSDCRYTRYADDFAFSFIDLDREKASNFVNQVSRIISSYGFRKNARKTKIIPPGSKKIITGLVWVMGKCIFRKN